MKSTLTTVALSLLASTFILSSCSKAVDCVLEGASTSVSATKDVTNAKLYTFP